MCEPTTIMAGLSLAIGAASALVQDQQARMQAEAQNKYQNAMAEASMRAQELNNQAAVKEYVEQSAAERISQMQEQKATSEELQQEQRERLKNQGTMLASSNAAGAAMDMLMGDYARQEAVSKERIRTRYMNTAVNAETALSSYKDKAQNRINSQQPYIAQQANTSSNTLGLSLGIAGAAVNAYDKYATWKAKIGTPPEKQG